NVQPTPATAQAVTAVQLPTALALTSSAASGFINYGQAVTFSATVSPAAPVAASALAGERGAFSDGAMLLGTGVLNAQGIATFAAPALGAGLHAITATYAGDAADQGSSNALRGGVLVNRVMPAFTRLTASQSILAGTASVTVSGVLSSPTAIPV